MIWSLFFSSVSGAAWHSEATAHKNELGLPNEAALVSKLIVSPWIFIGSATTVPLLKSRRNPVQPNGSPVPPSAKKYTAATRKLKL